MLDALRAVNDGKELTINASISDPVSTTSTEIKTKSGLSHVEVAIARETGGIIAANLLRARMSSGTAPDAVFVVGCAGLLDEKHQISDDEKGELPKGLVFIAKQMISSRQTVLLWLRTASSYQHRHSLHRSLVTSGEGSSNSSFPMPLS